jgi:tetratricopeptide (TPR) repeat protein
MLAISQLQAGKTKEAEQSMLELIQLDPSFIGGHENLATLYFQRKKEQKALYHAELALRERGDRAATLEMAIEIFRSYGQFDQALECSSKLIGLDPKNTAHLLTRARILNELDRDEELIGLLGGRAEPEVQQLLRQIEEENQKNDPAKLRAQKLLERGTQMGKSGLLKEAHKLFSSSIEIDPSNAVAYINRGSNLAQMGEFEEALKDLLQARQIDPNQAMTYYLLTAIYRDLGQVEAACSNKVIAESKGMTLPQVFDRYCQDNSH